MDTESQKKLEQFCNGLDAVLPYFGPVEQVIAQAIRKYWQEHKPAARESPSQEA